MSLDDTQRKKVADWLEQGFKLSEIQKKLADELGIKMTYMEVRFLLDDLRLKPKEEPKEEPKQPAAPLATQTDGVKSDEPLDEAIAPTATGKVSVTVDAVTRPGAMVSGTVKFSDGNDADWYLDQNGRLGVAPRVQGYKPPQADIVVFQTELQNELAKLGF
jgi:hypothetical protein